MLAGLLSGRSAEGVGVSPRLLFERPEWDAQLRAGQDWHRALRYTSQNEQEHEPETRRDR